MTEAKNPTREELTARCPTGVKIGIEQGSREETEIVFASIETEERLQVLVIPTSVVPMIQGCLDRIFYVREDEQRKREIIPGGDA